MLSLRLPLLMVLATIAVLPPVSRAQDTWGRLHFGMSPDEAKSTFNLPVHQASGSEIIKDYPLTLVANDTVVVQKLNVTPSFSFDENGKLQLITLRAQRDDHEVDVQAVRRLFEALSAKYGQPVTQTTPCSNETPEGLCKAVWRDADQQITFAFWGKRDHTLPLLIVAYQPLPTDI